MAKTRYTFKSGAPGAEPGLYKSCLNSERDISIRWWDGALWWDISSSRGSKSLPFKWPNGAAARGISMPTRIKRYGEQDRLCLRKITNQAEVRWGTAYKHFEPDEVLSYLVGKGVLPKNWRESFQEEMRATRSTKPVEDGWLQDGHMLYRLTDEPRPRNRDEIIVTMANSSRTEEARTRRAGELLDAIRAAAAAEIGKAMQ